MEQNYLVRAAKYLADLRKRKAWRKVVSGLGTAVVFCTVYALILPAITWSRPTVCEKEEHHHTDECYALVEVSPEAAPMAAKLPGQPLCSVESIYAAATQNQERVEEHAPFVLHTHTAECFMGEGGPLICPLFSYEPHVHDDNCYVETKVLVCGLAGTTPEETGPGTTPPAPTEPEIPLHQHNDTCYERVVICGLEEGPGTEGHHHTDACYTITQQTVPGELICTNTEEGHVHDENCYGPASTREERVLTCTLPESEPVPGHQHEEGCWELRLICGQTEGEPEKTVTIVDEQVPISGEAAAEEGGPANTGDQNATPVHVHTDACYQIQRTLVCDKDQYTEHLHVPACYDENGTLICGRVVTVSHVHTAECFQQDGGTENPGENQPEQPERNLICGKEEHTHTEECFASGEPEAPAAPDNTEQKNAWDALFWGYHVEEASDVILDARTSGVWSDTTVMEPERLAQLYAAPAEDLTRYLSQNIGIQIDQQLYNESHGPMDAGAQFSVLLTWSMNEASFSSMAYTYQFPQQVVVENVERRYLNDEAGETALAYSVENNQLSVTYYRPAAEVETTFLLKASWAPEVGEQTRVQWSPSTFTDVTFAKPELTITKVMGENGLRVEETGEVWADYTVTVANNSMVAAKAVKLKDTLESQYFHFARGGFENGADYSLTINNSDPAALSAEGGTPVTPGAEQFLTFENYDGGNVLTFPEFDLAAGESRVFQYKARMSSEDRELVDEAIAAAKDAAPVDAFAMPMSAEQSSGSGETVRNTATATCPACGEGVEFSASSQGTYNGLESKHIEDYTQTYNGETFDVTFTVNGDALLPPGISAERVEELGKGNFLLNVSKLPEDSADYQNFAQQINAKPEGAEDTSDTSEQLELAVLGLELRYNSMKLDLSDCEVMATVTPNETLLNYKPSKPVTVPAEGEEEVEVLGDKGFGIELKAFTLEEQTDSVTGTTTEETVEAGSIYIDRPEETESKPAAISDTPVTVAVNSSPTDSTDTLTIIGVAARTLAGAEEPAAVETTTIDNSTTVDAIQPITFAMKSTRIAVQSETDPYPEYTVQFYAYLDRPMTTGIQGEQAIVIDTSGKKLPGNNGNGVTNAPSPSTLTKIYYQDKVGLRTESKLLQIFTNQERKYNPKVSLNWQMLDNISYEVTESATTEMTDRHYNLTELWVLKSGKNANSVERSDWDIYNETQLASMQFTNDTNLTATGYILVTNDTVFRMVYEQNEGSHTNEVNFYDYDIGTQQTATTMITNLNGNGVGINSPENYPDQEVEYAFGNNNAGTPYGRKEWGTAGNHKNWLNMFNRNPVSKDNNTATFNGCTFGLVEEDYVDGKIDYNTSSPYLFNDGSANGKTAYDSGEYTLDFKREGDTYTLRGVNGAELTNLDVLEVARNADGSVLLQSTMKTPIWTNHFWPMDGAVTGDASDGHDPKSGGTVAVTTGAGQMPPSDNGIAHNNYFGMQASFEFTLPKGYVGPLDYYFFGDDDLWLFLDGTLVCDMGGVKSSTGGEYVNLADYVGKEADGSYTSGTHKLDLYYTERGASGSTCWMQFTIPNIRSVPLDPTPDGEKGSLRLYKEVSGVVDADQEYGFTLTIEDVTDIFSVKKYDKNLNATTIDQAKDEDGVYKSGVYEFTLKAGESLAVFDLPKNKQFTIVEDEDPTNPYTTTIKSSDRSNVEEGRTITGTSTADTTITVTYTNTFHYTLPETGGPGTTWYTYGALPALMAAVVLYKRSRKKGGTVS